MGVLTHGKTSTNEHRIWCGIITRCTNKRHRDYRRYGGRGIRVCDRWRSSFESFLSDMGKRPSGEHQVDRIDNDGDYEPSNCRWASRREQARNRPANVMLTHDGRTMCAVDWSAEMGMTVQALFWRLRHGWTVEEALTKPARKDTRRSTNGRA